MKKSALIWTGALLVLSLSTLSFSMCKPNGAKGQTVPAEGDGKAKSDTEVVKPAAPPLESFQSSSAAIVYGLVRLIGTGLSFWLLLWGIRGRRIRS